MQANNIFQLSGVDQVIPTHGIEGAKSYPMGPNSRAALFDDSEDVFYIKKTDANGFPEVRKYRFEEEILVDEKGTSGVSLNDIRSIIREEIGMVKEEILNGQQFISTTGNTENSVSSTYVNATNDKYSNANRQHSKGKSRTNSSVVANGENKQQSSGNDE